MFSAATSYTMDSSTTVNWKADYLIVATSNQVINVFNTNALQNQIPVDPDVLSPFNDFFSIKQPNK